MLPASFADTGNAGRRWPAGVLAGLEPRAASIPLSCLHEVFGAAEAWELEVGRPVIRLHVGEPAFPAPPEAAEALGAAARDGRTSYTAAEGMPELRSALAGKLEAANGHRTSTDLIFVTPGSCQGIAAVLHSVAVAGGELLLPELHWPIHLQQCLLAGLRPVFYPLRGDFSPDLDGLAAAGSSSTIAVLVNSPANPSGAVLGEETLTAILELAHARGWHVISDEAYEDFVYEGAHVSMAALEAGLPTTARRVFSTFTFSKSYAMTGYRLGYVAVPHARAARALRPVQEASIVAPSTPVQFAGLAALASRRALDQNRAAAQAGRDLIVERLGGTSLLSHVPAGGWYALLDVGETRLDAERFAARFLREYDVAVAPGSGFALRPALTRDGGVSAVEAAASARTLIRLAFCGDLDLLERGLERLVAFAGSAGLVGSAS
jgi:aspartate aminotransferase